MALQVGLIGLGRHGRRYANHLLEPIPGLRLVAVCRRDAADGAAFAQQRGVQFYQHACDLIADPDVHAVLVVTPAGATPFICQEAVKRRKPLLIEKPLALKSADAREMIRKAEAGGVPIMTAHTLRFDAAIEALSGALCHVGVPRYGVAALRIEPRPEPTAERGKPGLLLEIGVHLFDLIRYLTGDEVTDVRCELEGEPGAECRAFISLRMGTSGVPFLLELSRIAPVRTGRIEWIGDRGQLMADWVRATFRRHIEGEEPVERVLNPRATIVHTLTAFADAVVHGRPMPISGWDGYAAVRIAEACYESAASASTIALTTEWRDSSVN